MEAYLGYVVLGTVVLIFVYLAVRVASFAYFRSRLDYLRGLLKALRKGND